MLNTLAANSLWFLTSLPESLTFRRALDNVAETQQAYLLHLLQQNATAEFGRRYNFDAIGSVSEYQERVPLATYGDFQSAIKQIGDGRQNVLTNDPVQLLEPTSGSTTATKYVPYTATLKTEFQRAIAPWIVDLFRHDPQLLKGQAYWSVSPVVQRNQHTTGGIPIGFEEDSEYFGNWQQYFVRSIQAVPPQVKFIEDINTFRYVTLLFLLRSRQLSLISVWNPTFLILLVERLTNWWTQLIDDIEHGQISPPAPLPSDLQTAFETLNRPNPRRAAGIRRIFQTGTPSADIHTRLWPQLRLISCWTDAQAAPYAGQLAKLFPQAKIQSKGLLATEGIVSLPLVGQPGAGLALRSHFFEFLPVNTKPNTQPLLAHQLETGRQYNVILTTGGGLYRYQLHDLVEVVGHLKQCPLIRFVGKSANISDHFGEKLNEMHVQRALDTVLHRQNLQPTLAMLACETTLQAPGYILFIEASTASDDLLRITGNELDIALQENFHYRYCQDLGQLAPLRVFRVKQNGLAAYIATCQAHGQRAGNIKPVALHRMNGWLARFDGTLLD